MTATDHIDRTVTLVDEDCCVCGIAFAVPADFRRKRRHDGGHFYCPNGHDLHYTEPEIDRLQKQLRAAEARATAAHDQATAARRHADHEFRGRKAAERSAAAFKGVATKLRDRAARGQCPCCHRTFADLARHMVSQHPDFADAELAEEVSADA